ncbi:hypothetical protein COOONC_08941 [Cooperia oncophora]
MDLSSEILAKKREDQCNTNCYIDIKLLKEPVRVKIQRGVRQGEVISPKLFSAALELVMRQIELLCGIGDRRRKTSIRLMFADDIVLIGSEPSALESSLNILSEASQSIGLVIHPGKTKWMKNNYDSGLSFMHERISH